MMKQVTHGLMALTLAGGVLAASVDHAEARRGRGAALLGLGIIGGLALGAAAAHSRGHYYDHGPRCYRGPEECGWKNRHCFHNRYGDYVCRGGHYTCWRPRYCD